MTTNQNTSKKKVLYLFPHVACGYIKEIKEKKIPSERLYGLIELKARGWKADISDARWLGPLSNARRALRRFFEIPNIKTINEIKKNDIVIVKDEFSVALLLVSKIFGKKIIYLDSMFNIPKRSWKRWGARLNLKFSNEILCYSKLQAEMWEKSFNLSGGRIKVVTYCIDMGFYPKVERDIVEPKYLLAVGRDLGRDFDTLVSAAQKLNIDVKIVTLPYLIPEQARNNKRVEILQNISYADLFNLYKGALAAVVPLRPNTYYPSGIRAVLESIALGTPVIATSTTILEEYFTENDGVIYTPPCDADALAKNINTVLNEQARIEAITDRANDRIRREFDINNFTGELEKIITNS